MKPLTTLEDKLKIIDTCKNASSSQILSRLPFGYNVIKISAAAVVKFGSSESMKVEAENQKEAFNLLDPAIVRVPRVFDFFIHEHQGYLVMEYVQGQLIQDLQAVHHRKLTSILSHFQSISVHRLGNLSGRGRIYSCPFPDEGIFCDSIKSMTAWFNRRIIEKGMALAFDGCALNLCHRDLAPRNLLWQDEGDIVFLLDWQTAGFYPPLFELCTQMNGRDLGFNKQLEEIILSISPLRPSDACLLLNVWANCFRYSFDEDVHVLTGRAQPYSRQPAIPKSDELRKFINEQNRNKGIEFI